MLNLQSQQGLLEATYNLAFTGKRVTIECLFHFAYYKVYMFFFLVLK